MKIKVGVLFGGETVEHEVSIISAITAMNKIDQEKYDVIPIYMTKDREWYTGEILKDIDTYKDMDLIKRYTTNVVLYAQKGRFVLKKKNSLFNSEVTDIDIAFPIVHGTNVEDGTLQGYLQTIGIPYVGVNVFSAAVGQDKVYMKNIFESNKLPITKYTWFYDSDFKKNQDEVIKEIEKLKYPVIVKPATTGSSVGIGIAGDEKELVEIINDAMQYDSKILVEDVVENLREVNISVVGNYESQKVSEIEEVTSKNKFLSYADKYIGDGTIGRGSKKTGVKVGAKGQKGGLPALSRIPADISDKLRKEVEEVAIKAFKVLGSSGVVRIDFLIDSKEDKVYINEINSIPGNLAFYLWEAKGVEFSELLNDIINIGIKDYKNRTNKTHSFETNILAGYTGGMKGMKGTKKLK